MGKLTALQVKALTEPGRYSDGDGLILKIGPTGGRSWILRVQVDGKRRDIGLGNARSVSLKEAREAAGDLRKQARAGLDPVAERRRQAVVIPTFREACKVVHEELGRSWKKGKHGDQWLTTLESYAWPKLGKLAVNEIEGPLIRDVLAEIWLTKPETARRVKQRIGTVLDWCYVKGFRSSEAPMRSLSKGLPRQPRKDGNFAAMAYEAVPQFLSDLHDRQMSVSRLALELLILTATRSGEVRGARWSEFDADLTVWTIPAARMKAGKAHAIPLSRQAADVVRQARNLLARPFRPAVSRARPQTPRGRSQARGAGDVGHDAAAAGAGHGSLGYGPRLSLELSRLGGRQNQPSARGGRGCACSHAREQGRSRLSAHRLLRQAPRIDAGLGGLLRSANSLRRAFRQHPLPLDEGVDALDDYPRRLADLDGLDLAPANKVIKLSATNPQHAHRIGHPHRQSWGDDIGMSRSVHRHLLLPAYVRSRHRSANTASNNELHLYSGVLQILVEEKC